MKRFFSGLLLLSLLGGVFLPPSSLRAQATQPAASTPNPFTGPQADLAYLILNTLKTTVDEFKQQGIGSVSNVALSYFLLSASGSNINPTILGNGQGVPAFISSLKTMSPAQLNQFFTHDLFVQTAK